MVRRCLLFLFLFQQKKVISPQETFSSATTETGDIFIGMPYPLPTECRRFSMSPFFDYYADDIKQFFSEKWELLADYNLAVTKKMIELLGGDDILRQKTFQKPSDKTEIKPYYQTFQKRHGFIPNLSILDLLFNEGPDSILFL